MAYAPLGLVLVKMNFSGVAPPTCRFTGGCSEKSIEGMRVHVQRLKLHASAFRQLCTCKRVQKYRFKAYHGILVEEIGFDHTVPSSGGVRVKPEICNTVHFTVPEQEHSFVNADACFRKVRYKSMSKSGNAQE
jgi:hypothetical protein